MNRAGGASYPPGFSFQVCPLRGSRAPVASVALGYESEAAFARAFKRETGTSPARWRRMQLAG